MSLESAPRFVVAIRRRLAAVVLPFGWIRIGSSASTLISKVSIANLSSFRHLFAKRFGPLFPFGYAFAFFLLASFDGFLQSFRIVVYFVSFGSLYHRIPLILLYLGRIAFSQFLGKFSLTLGLCEQGLQVSLAMCFRRGS